MTLLRKHGHHDGFPVLAKLRALRYRLLSLDVSGRHVVLRGPFFVDASDFAHKISHHIHQAVMSGCCVLWECVVYV